MAIAKKSEDVPKAMKEKFARIVALTDHFAQQHLNDEYAEFIRFATAALWLVALPMRSGWSIFSLILPRSHILAQRICIRALALVPVLAKGSPNWCAIL
jgi:hypothetical protein